VSVIRSCTYAFGSSPVKLPPASVTVRETDEGACPPSVSTTAVLMIVGDAAMSVLPGSAVNPTRTAGRPPDARWGKSVAHTENAPMWRMNGVPVTTVPPSTVRYTARS
jgi:hypothetical protein